MGISDPTAYNLNLRHPTRVHHSVSTVSARDSYTLAREDDPRGIALRPCSN